jgi:hypothetical protein
MKRTRIGDWPTVRVPVHPRTLEAIERTAEQRALSVSAIIREASTRRTALRPSEAV